MLCLVVELFLGDSFIGGYGYLFLLICMLVYLLVSRLCSCLMCCLVIFGGIGLFCGWGGGVVGGCLFGGMGVDGVFFLV